MEKIIIKNEIFNDLLSDELINLFHREYKKETINKENLNILIANLNKCIEKLNSINFNEFNSYINNSSALLNNNTLASISTCKKCSKLIYDRYQKSISINFSPLITNIFCNCEQQDIKFNQTRFLINFNFLIANVVNRINI